MQLIYMYAAPVYSYLSKISSEIYIFHFGYLSSGHSIFTWVRMWGSVVILRSQTGSESKGLDATWNCCLAFQVITFWNVSSQNGKGKAKWCPFSWTIGLLRTGIVFRRFLIGTKSAGCLDHVFRPSARVNSACTGRIFVKFDISHFY
jgi:hypothetical protein